MVIWHNDLIFIFQDLANYKMLCKVQEKNLMEKEAEMTVTQQQLSELQRMRDVIYEISGGKKKM